MPTISLVLKHLRSRHYVEGGAPFLVDRDRGMDIVVPVGKPRGALRPAYRPKGILIDRTSGHHAPPKRQHYS